MSLLLVNGLKEKVGHLGMGNKNLEDILAAWRNIIISLESYMIFS